MRERNPSSFHSHLLLCAISTMLLTGTALADSRPDVDTDITRTTNIDKSRETNTDISKMTSIDISRETSTNTEVSMTSSRQDLSADLHDLSIVVNADADTLADGTGGPASVGANITAGPVNVSTGDNFGGIASFNTSTGLQNAAVGGVSVASSATISFGR